MSNSVKTEKLISEFENHLRTLCYEAYEIKYAIADEEGCQNGDQFPVEAHKYAYMEHFMDQWIEDWFGGYNYPTD